MCSSSSDAADSRLEESEGTCSAAAALGLSAIEHRWSDDLDRDCFALQQNVSRFHNRQLRFSNRLPSWIACDVLDKMDHCRLCQWTLVERGPDLPYHAKQVLDAGRVDRPQGLGFDLH